MEVLHASGSGVGRVYASIQDDLRGGRGPEGELWHYQRYPAKPVRKDDLERGGLPER